MCKDFLTISKSCLSIKVIESRSRLYFNKFIPCIWLQVIYKVTVTHQGQSKNMYLLSNCMSNLTYFNTLILCVWLQVINKVKFIHQGEGHIKVKVKYLHPFKLYVALSASGWFAFDWMRSCFLCWSYRTFTNSWPCISRTLAKNNRKRGIQLI